MPAARPGRISAGRGRDWNRISVAADRIESDHLLIGHVGLVQPRAIAVGDQRAAVHDDADVGPLHGPVAHVVVGPCRPREFAALVISFLARIPAFSTRAPMDWGAAGPVQSPRAFGVCGRKAMPVSGRSQGRRGGAGRHFYYSCAIELCLTMSGVTVRLAPTDCVPRVAATFRSNEVC